MRPFSVSKLVVLTAVALAGAMTEASATAILSFGVVGVGSYVVNTGNITLLTLNKTLPPTELVGGIIGSNPGLVTGVTPVTFSLTPITLSTVSGLLTTQFDLFAGTILTFHFDRISSPVLIVPSGANSNGTISEQFQGSVTADTSPGSPFLGQTATLSETCTQTGLGAAITCSESVLTPGLSVPEPSSLALIGIGLAGFSVIRRRRKSGNSVGPELLGHTC